MKLRPNESVVLEGTYLYDGRVECRIRVIYSPFRRRTADYALAQEIEADSYYVEYGSPVKKGEFASRSAVYSSLDEAIKDVWRIPAIGATVEGSGLDAALATKPIRMSGLIGRGRAGRPPSRLRRRKIKSPADDSRLVTGPLFESISSAPVARTT